MCAALMIPSGRFAKIAVARQYKFTALLLNCSTPFQAVRIATCILRLNPTPLIMGLSQDVPRTAGDLSPPAWSVMRREGNSHYLRFRSISVVMRMPSDLYALLRNGGWNSFASVNVRKLWAVVGLLLNRCFRVREEYVSAEASSMEVITKTATSTGWDSVVNVLREHIVGSRKVRWFWKRQQSVPSETISVGVKSKKLTATTWNSLPNDIHANILQRVEFRDLIRLQVLSKHWKKFIEGGVLRQARGGVSEGDFTAINYCIKNKSWCCSGYDLHSKSWRSFPPVSYLPPSDAELFKEYSVCGHRGLMCAEVSKSPTKGELVVFNPWTGESQSLPPLLHPRNPVLVHISVDSAKKSYKVIVAGSSSASDEHLSRKVEVFDSSTSKWKEVCDLPGPAFGLNEHQAGVCLNGKLFLITFLESGGRGMVAFDLEEEKWLPSMTTPIPWSSYSDTLQLDVIDGKLFILSEQQRDQSVHHCIDELAFLNPKAGVSTRRWRSFVKVKKSGGRGLQVYPDHTCVGFGEEKLGIFNPLSKKLRNILLALWIGIVPIGACAEDQSMDSLNGMFTSNAWESPDSAKAVAGTILAGLMIIGAAKFAWRVFRRHHAPGNRFDIMQGLKNSDTPTRGDPLFLILPDIPATEVTERGF